MLQYIQGDLFQSNDVVLAHACNCRGAWGAGVAAIFRKKFPHAFQAYKRHCSDNLPLEILGTAFLADTGDGRWVACLFTSDHAGAGKLAPTEILVHTATAMADLERQMTAYGQQSVSMPKINAGLFAVPWENTEEVIAKSTLNITVYTLD